MIYENYELRGRDPNLLLEAFDKVVNNASRLHIDFYMDLTRIDINANPVLFHFFQTSDLSGISLNNMICLLKDLMN